MRTTRSLAETTHVLLRVGAGILFMQHGLQKMFGLLGGKVVPLVSLTGLAGVLELVGAPCSSPACLPGRSPSC